MAIQSYGKQTGGIIMAKESLSNFIETELNFLFWDARQEYKCDSSEMNEKLIQAEQLLINVWQQFYEKEIHEIRSVQE